MATLTLQQAFDNALRHQQAGRPREAEHLYRQILAIHPTHSGAMHYLGLAAHQQGQNDLAIELIRKAIAMSPSVAEAYNSLGITLQAKHQFDQAVAEFRRAIALKPNYVNAHYNLANCLNEAGKTDEAIAAYRGAIACNPKFLKAHRNLAQVLIKQGFLQPAIAAFRQVILLDPTDAQAHAQLAACLGRAGYMGDAIASYRRAVSLKPKDDGIVYNLALALQRNGQLDQAIAAYRQTIALRPDYFEAYCNLGNVLRGTGKLDQAIASYRRAAALRPDHPITRKSLHVAMQHKVVGRSANLTGASVLRSGGAKTIIETGEKYAFNGASALTPAGRLMVFRRGDFEQEGIRYRWLDGKPGGGLLPHLFGCGDPRLMSHERKLIITSNFQGVHGNDRMEMQEVIINGRELSTRPIARFDCVTGMELARQEKNWVPFSAAGDLYFEYSIHPHIVLKYNPQTSSLQSAFNTAAQRLPFELAGAGPPRLNTPAVQLGQTFLSVFHVVCDGDYYSAFYRFSALPPFALIAMSKSPVLWPEDADGIAWRSTGTSWRLLYIQSLEVDERADRVLMFGGENDLACISIEMKLSTILADMAPVT
jgi:tetratricopeptide (TPR) repeat protein